ncbi:ABC transporter [Photobacterium kishitanii]|uniref:ABC transporter n=1 Tax=Photobacterium kishitanii TaxID=318456 RepID=A0AAX0YY25_9GAMM|nr:ABC transporter [Photobacterium kishitanii]KJG56605.1 ABC transporter [Photobacterium kishitanii]KJG61075.1 ABC transporter [Photobacterium kishitanii]KJG65237.1 ABC transporter [Photobacterium kishitanii]KJG68834.1 ABC transporter [Photobacterium kishitanii]PSX21041.1 ABC transporter [Photobacterium kishitanii]
MKQSYTLIKNELLEHKIIIRLPLFLALFTMVVVVLVLSNINNFSFNIQMNDIDGWQPPITASSFAGVVGSVSLFIAGIVSLLSFFTYSARALAKERKEGSLAFWHSMPVSDSKAIAIKLLVALVVIPLFSSLLLLFVDITVWIVAMWVMPANMLVENSLSLVAIGLHWGQFISMMAAMSLALLPIACVIFCASQLTEHPLLVLFVAITLVKFISYMLFDSMAIGTWLNKVSNLAFNILTSNHPWQTLTSVGMVTLLGLLVLSVGIFKTSVHLRSGD